MNVIILGFSQMAPSSGDDRIVARIRKRPNQQDSHGQKILQNRQETQRQT
jgi:hypothetical protein